MMSDATFERIVREAVEGIPAPLKDALENIAIVIEEYPPDHVLEELGDAPLFGLYEGIPLTERGDYGGFAMPDRVTVYRKPLCEMCETTQELVDQVTITVIHELAHHFGIDDDTLHELGWG